MFDKEYSFRGKHADYVNKLTAELDTSAKIKLFERNLDVYIFAPIIGMVYGRKSIVDDSSMSTTKIFTDQLTREISVLKYNYRLIMLLDQKKTLDIEERMNRAFRYDNNYEKRKEGDEIFNQYVLGGVEVLYEKLMLDATDVDDYLTNTHSFLTEYYERYNGSIDNETIYKLCMMAKD